MIPFSENLSIETEQKLKQIEYTAVGNTTEYYFQAILIFQEALEKLCHRFTQQKVINAEVEIQFFKTIKPQWTSKLIYYNERYNMEQNKPAGTQKTIRKYYAKQIKKINQYFIENQEFYKYYNNGNQHLDDKYFLRNQQDIKLSLDSYYFIADKSFTTGYDYKAAQLIAFEKLQKQLTEEIKEYTNKGNNNQSNLKWTGSKVGMVELIYALHAEGVFNEGKCELREIVYNFGKIFNVEIGQVHRTFYEICARKSERAKFLNTLKENLLKRIEQSDK
ncbi:RteC domain-containing protein [Flavobacterium macrobrachii]|uniref:RteC domain-containing protein n=1 Tax=Flavobacterium macrobrachii TaxID=591204 RepID=A0ABS2CSS5_9FLAO|nr:RteC domain-containing protein [Flavobacterium macrobrachii]MBM6498007.1 RteC domain-containing protein [Flavobacterium macrobrachii]